MQWLTQNFAMKVKLNRPNHVIAAQMGWSESAVQQMAATYARTEPMHPLPRPLPKRR